MSKSYTDFMNEISADELYEGLLAHGLFSEKLPPLFTSQPFYEYCKTLSHSFQDKSRQFIYHESMRNINVPRSLGIPNPLGYQQLCRCIADNWRNLQRHFEENTVDHDYRISRIHLQKLKNQQCLFDMNYIKDK